MRAINNIVIHCTATPRTTSIASIQNYWDSLGWQNPGYHYIIEFTGRVEQLQPLDKPSNGVRGHNQDSIHMSYIGGIDHFGEPEDTRTQPQKNAMEGLVKGLRGVFPEAEIKGHRDFPGVNKACPSFEVSDWLNEIN